MKAYAQIPQISQHLYEGIFDTDAWYRGIDGLRHAIGGAMFHHFTYSSEQGRAIASASSMDYPLESIREYEQRHAANDERINVILTLPAGGVMFDHHHFDARQMSRSPIYDWLLSFDLRHTAGIVLREEAGTKEILGLIRAKADAAYGEHERELCRQLAPHLLAASALRTKAIDLAEKARWGLSAMEGFHHGIMVVDDHARIHYMNSRAEALMGTVGHSRHGQCSFATAGNQGRFRKALEKAAGRFGPVAGSAFLAKAEGNTITVSVLPIKESHTLVSVWQTPRIMVVLAPRNGCAVSPAVLQETLGITPAQARLAHALAQGMTVKEYAEREGCSEHTARSHLRDVMRITDCRRQVELVQLVQSVRAIT